MKPQESIEFYQVWIGCKVRKGGTSKEPKPFKSGFKVNTVKGVIEHPILGCPAYTFEEDDSYVRCDICNEVE